MANYDNRTRLRNKKRKLEKHINTRKHGKKVGAPNDEQAQEALNSVNNTLSGK